MLWTHTNGPSTSILAICISKLACSFYGTMGNLLGCLISKTLQYRKMCILSNTRTLALVLLQAHNGVFLQVPHQCFMDPVQRKTAPHPIGVDVWRISPILNPSLRRNPPVCTISESLLDHHRHKGKAVHVKIRLGNIKSSTDIPQYDALRHPPV